MTQLKSLTSLPLEVGNIVHDVLEAFLRRLQKSDSNIDESRFFEYARLLTEEYLASKTFIEVYTLLSGMMELKWQIALV